MAREMLAPLRHLGALAYGLFWLLAASGLYLYLRLDTAAEGAYASISELEWWFGGLLRSLHRYAADAFVIIVVAHLVRELALGRFRGFRAFSWISGVPLVWLLYASGIVGYWLVWDARSQFSALATAEWFHAAGIGAEPMARNFLGAEQVPDRLFSLFVFLHIGLPLALLAGMWVHVQRLGRPRTVAPRLHAWTLAGGLAALALVLPARSAQRWDPAAVPDALPVDWWLQFPHALMYATSPGALWAIAAGLTILLVLLPYVSGKESVRVARVDAPNCNGCGRCAADCPYAAIELRNAKAHVFAERCAGCGICAGACPSSTPFRSVQDLVSGIDLPGRTVHDLRRRLQEALQAPGAAAIHFQCEKSPAGSPGAIALPCLAMLPPSFVEYALRNGAARVKATGCEPCAYRLGMALSAERFAGEREPHLRRNVRVTGNDHEYTFALR